MDHYVRKFGKLSSPKKDSAKNVSTTGQLDTFHMLVRLGSKSFKLGFKSMWTKNFHMFKLDLEKGREQETTGS